MDKNQLRRIFPTDRNDIDAANSLIKLGYPVLSPVSREVLQFLKLSESSVADAFCVFLSQIGKSSVPDPGLVEEISKTLCSSSRSNGQKKFRLLNDVLPNWSKKNIELLANALRTAATCPDACNNDLLALKLLFDHGILDIGWTSKWMKFKAERHNVRSALLEELRQKLENLLSAN